MLLGGSELLDIGNLIGFEFCESLQKLYMLIYPCWPMKSLQVVVEDHGSIRDGGCNRSRGVPSTT